MNGKKRGMTAILLAGVFCGIFLVSFAVMNFIMKPQTVEAPVQNLNNSVPVVAESKIIGSHTIVKEQIYYRKCRHMETQELKNHVDYVGKTHADLEAGGWQVYDAPDGAVIITKDMEGFCPADEEKRHIAQAGDYLGIYHGPVNMGGELITEIPIKVSELPQDWQTRILTGGYEFKGEEELMDALENLDELMY
mgnify:CR=1 FL=1